MGRSMVKIICPSCHKSVIRVNHCPKCGCAIPKSLKEIKKEITKILEKYFIPVLVLASLITDFVGKPVIVGNYVDAIDKYGCYYVAEVLSIEGTKVTVHYVNWKERYNETLDILDKKQILSFGTITCGKLWFRPIFRTKLTIELVPGDMFSQFMPTNKWHGLKYDEKKFMKQLTQGLVEAVTDNFVKYSFNNKTFILDRFVQTKWRVLPCPCRDFIGKMDM